MQNSMHVGEGAMILRSLLAALVLLSLAATVEARNTKYDLPISGVTQNTDYQNRLGSEVAFFLLINRRQKSNRPSVNT